MAVRVPAVDENPNVPHESTYAQALALSAAKVVRARATVWPAMARQASALRDDTTDKVTMLQWNHPNYQKAVLVR